MSAQRRPEAAFTLVELLVVISILAMLLAIGAFSYGKFLGRGDHAATVALIESLKTQLEHYRNATGDYPPSRLEAFGVKPSNHLFEGIEAMVVGLMSPDYDGPRPEERHLRNLDEDAADRNVTRLGKPALLEVVDAWENPLVYIRYDDYEREFDYEFRSADTGEWVPVRVKAAVNELTGAYFALDSYQLVSAGEDGVLGTDDDITSY